jgi:hypothetical protein
MPKKKKSKIDIILHKYKEQLLAADKIISIIIFLLLGIFRPDYVVIASFFLLIIYILLTNRKVLLKSLGIAFTIALIWMIIGRKEYGYNQNFLSLFGINLFSLFAWALGLFISYLIFLHFEHIFHNKTFWSKFGLYLAFYWPLLIFAETIGYHWFNIQNSATAMYLGLPICNCMHASWWMKIVYFSLGPIYFIICNLLKLDNPHYTKTRKSKKK